MADGRTYDTPLYALESQRLAAPGQEAMVNDGVVYLTIRIPRCAGCEKEHSRLHRGALVGALLGGAVSGVAAYLILRFAGPLIGETVAEMISLLLVLCCAAAGTFMGWRYQGGTSESPPVLAERYPVVQSLLQAGWKWGTADD